LDFLAWWFDRVLYSIWDKTLLISIAASYDIWWPPNQIFSPNFQTPNGHLLILNFSKAQSYECFQGHITCQVACYIPLLPLTSLRWTCVLWTQNVCKSHEVKMNRTKGRLGENNHSGTFVLTPLKTLGQFNKTSPKWLWYPFLLEVLKLA